MAMAKDNKFIYASYKKFDAKKGMQIDEDLTYSSEEDAIEHFIKRLSGIDEDMEEEFNDGDDIKIYLYQLDKNRTPYLFKKVEVEKDDSDAGYKITDEDEEELPDDFVPYSDDDDSSETDSEDDDEKDEPEDEEESEDSKDDKKEKEEDEKDQEDDPSDDVQDIEESVLSLSYEFSENPDLVREVANKAHAIIKEFGLNDKDSLTESMSYVSEGVDQVLNVLLESIPESNYKDRLALATIHQYFTEKTLKAKDRNALDDSEFGIPSLRKYPIPDKAHVMAAIQRFNYVDSKHEKELAENLIKAMKKFNMMNEVDVGPKNRFKKYVDSSYKNFKESYDINPFPLELTKEFSVGAMLPMMGSTEGWGTKLANTPIEDVVSSNNQDMEKYATLYDTSELENDAIEYRKKIYTGTSLDDGIITREEALCESVIPHRNIIFDKEVEELVKKLKEFINNPKNDFMEDILKKSLNFKKNIYTIKLNDQDGKDSNKVITKIKSCGFRDVDDQGVKVLYEKEVKGLLLTLIYDTVGDKIRVTYEPYDKDKELKESAEILEASKDDIDEDIRAIVDKLNRKGYKTKYSCSGHTKARIKEDGYRNGIYKGKLYTTARIVFDDDYKLNPPKGWKIKTFDGKIGIYPVAPDYDYSNGVPDDAFEKWKNEYMAELKMWVNGLPDKPGPTEESVDDLLDDFSELLFEDAYFSEKKTREEYRVQRFKDKHDYDKKSSTIKVDGKRYKVDMDYKNPSMKVKDENNETSFQQRQTAAEIGVDDPTIHLDKNFFKLKNDKRREAVLQHEVGHTKLHSMKGNSDKIDKSMKTNKFIEEFLKDSIDNCINSAKQFGMSEEEAKKALYDNGFKQTAKKICKEYQNGGLSKDETRKKLRESAMAKLSKYKKSSNDHINTREFEADRYAANKTSTSALKKGLRQYNKLTAKNIDDSKYAKRNFKVALDKNKDSNYDDDVKEHVRKELMKKKKGIIEVTNKRKSAIKKAQNISSAEDYNQRQKALKDKSLTQKEKDNYR